MINTNSMLNLKNTYTEKEEIYEIEDKYIERALEEAEKEAEDPNIEYYTHEEVFDSLRRIISGSK